MRPHRLEMEGFGTFRERVEIDFNGLDLVALVGPTGSGKSTVIDAITFALYGSVARYDNTSLVAPVIHQLSAEARVRFDFELAGLTYSAVRVVRRTKAAAGGGPRATTREARLERTETDGTSTVLAGNVSELDGEVGELIGLDFHQFTRTIVLPQGEFAEFLTDDPGNRQKLLRRLLDLDIYARMGGRARDAAREAGQRIELLTEERERLARFTPELRAQTEARRDAVAAFAATLDDRLVEVATVEGDLAECRQEVTTLDESLTRLQRVQVPDTLLTSDAVTSAALTALEAARRVLAEAEQTRTKALASLAEAGDPGLMRSLLARQRELHEVGAAADALSVEHDAAVRAEADAAEARSEAEQAAASLGEHLRTARRNADAAHWVARLVEGEPCPVCAQMVLTAPEVRGPDELEAVETQERAAARSLQEASTAAAKAVGRVQSLAADLEQKRKQYETLAAEIADEETVTSETLALAEAAANDADEASRALRHAETTARSAEAELSKAREVEQGHRRAFTTQRDAVVALGAPAPEGTSLVDDWQELAAWAGAEVEIRNARRAEIATEGRRLAEHKAEVLGALAADAEKVGVNGDPAVVRADAARVHATVEAEVVRIVEQLARAGELADRIAESSQHKIVHDALGQHLQANGFERWLLAEALDHLVARATGRLLELSNGRYSLEAVDGSFAVRDHANADERRDIRTLSGGETFLASLALALALSESIAELATVDGPRLESIFLDEGFGTLDAETLDTLAAAIEELSASGRLVAIVTHVRELAERMPVRFEVRKDATTSTVERVET